MKIVYRLLFVLLISMFVFGCGDKTASIEGKIVDGNGKPLPGVSVLFKQVQPTKGFEQFETKTGPDGAFKFSGFAPSSDYIITPMSDKWKTKVTKKIKTLEAGQNLVLAPSIKIRFQQMKDGTVIDTKTGMQWKIYPVKDMTAGTVLGKVKSLNEAGFTDWRLPSRADLESLIQDKAPAKAPGSESAPVVKTCCAWIAEPNSADVDWKFYVEEDIELWASNKETPDNRIVIVRNFSGTPMAAAPATPSSAVAPATGKPDQASTDNKAPGAKVEPSPTAVPVTVAPAAQKDVAKVVDKASASKQEPAKTAAVEPVKAEPIKVAKSELSGTSETLFYEVGSSKLTAQELVKLKTFYSKIKGDKGTVIIYGHSDASSAKDTTASNLLLSIQRSSNVATALKNMGVSKQIKLEIRALGEGKPVASNDTPEGRKQNRRVDVSFVSE